MTSAHLGRGAGVDTSPAKVRPARVKANQADDEDPCRIQNVGAVSALPLAHGPYLRPAISEVARAESSACAFSSQVAVALSGAS